MNGSKHNKNTLTAAALAVLLLLIANCSCGVISGMGDESNCATGIISLCTR